MQKVEDVKAYYYFDEAGDPQILARKGINLVERGVSSKVFMVGYSSFLNSQILLFTALQHEKMLICSEKNLI